jgi:NadR type nicotinamide-nucleotide adenylyltransferase
LIRKIVITGPESTGKSTLTKLLANHYQTTWVKEYAREYLEKLGKPYTFDDVLHMAKIQLEKEKEAALKKPNTLFLDTDLTVFKVWINEKYHKEVDWIEHEIKQSSNKTFLLCNIDIPWQDDPLREHPALEDRQRIFNQYLEIMQQNKFNYHIISGDVATRLKKCIEIVDNLI